MLAAIVGPRNIGAEIMDEQGATMVIRLIGSPRVPTMSIEHQNVPRLAFDHDFIRV